MSGLTSSENESVKVFHNSHVRPDYSENRVCFINASHVRCEG